MRTVVLLGPQRHQPTLAAAVERVGMEGPMAAVTAGWEEREDEIDELSEHLGREVVNLRLHARTEDVFRRDPEFLAAYRRQRARLRELRDVYSTRLRHLMKTIRDLDRTHASSQLLSDAREETFETLRALDEGQASRVAEAHAEFADTIRPSEREPLAEQAGEVQEMLDRAGGLALAGGHVGTLLHRLQLFEVARRFPDRPVFAWSAGAMVACELVVIYHDDPPEGPGHEQVLEPGLGLCPGIIALPHAARRLKLDDRRRVARFAQRFAPRRCVAFDDATCGLTWDGREFALLGSGARRFTRNGNVVPLREIPAA